MDIIMNVKLNCLIKRFLRLKKYIYKEQYWVDYITIQFSHGNIEIHLYLEEYAIFSLNTYVSIDKDSKIHKSIHIHLGGNGYKKYKLLRDNNEYI